MALLLSERILARASPATRPNGRRDRDTAVKGQYCGYQRLR